MLKPWQSRKIKLPAMEIAIIKDRHERFARYTKDNTPLTARESRNLLKRIQKKGHA